METLLLRQRTFFADNQTRSVAFRLENLRKLKRAVIDYTPALLKALWQDLHKSDREACLTEIDILLAEIDGHCRHVKSRSRPRRVATPLYLFPAKSYVVPEPLGVALIIAPWNYPVQLLLNPLAGAIAAGCCAVLKPSPYTPAVAGVLQEMIDRTFPSEYIALVRGGREVNTRLLELAFDCIFYTGSPTVGRVVMQAAAAHLTPAVLELGGKSPCIVDRDASIAVAARRIAWGKTVNAGQTCVAPDYVFVHRTVEQTFIAQLKMEIERMLGPDPRSSPYFGRMVNDKAFDRVERLLHQGRVVYGGQTDRSQRYIAPTIIDEVQPDFPIMQEEIFGPVLPVLGFDDIGEPLHYIASHEKPLALYYFGGNARARRILERSTSGGVCINDTLMHAANPALPFGGVGNSGMGRYHGKESFLAFSNMRSVLWNRNAPDFKMRYTPYRPFTLIRRLMQGNFPFNFK